MCFRTQTNRGIQNSEEQKPFLDSVDERDFHDGEVPVCDSLISE